ncbi:MAG: hypothetical protein A3I66_03960 [Burkholderiales bacterium RIFCSPLOWO2_02_FULL_57_36]|nr:MAG: hypothetical protein A3I66_03960 [Burkholderiales bacterium RIFCSPLOWO2_02_FULL_57_36]
MTRIDFGFNTLQAGYRERLFTPVDVVQEVFRRIRERGNDYVWTELVSEQDAISEAERISAAEYSRNVSPLFGIPFSVKDNVHVTGMHTTCGCDGFDLLPHTSAASVAKAIAAGAIFIGKNTLDQFATGLNGTRTLGGYCRNVFDERYIPGGSSSGSGVAVAAGLVSFSLGSDTGGSGRVPAAMNNIVGVKPTLGLVSSGGMIYNNRFFDCVPVFARTVEDGYAVLETIRGFDVVDDFSRPDADSIPLKVDVADRFVFAMPHTEQLEFFGDSHAETAFEKAVEAMERAGGQSMKIDFSMFIEAGRLPFDSGLLAERAVSYGDVLKTRPETVHPAVAAMIRKGLDYSGTETVHAIYKMNELRNKARQMFQKFDVLMTPTVGRAYTCDELKADPIGLNNNIGYYTYPISPLDLCALALPASIRGDGIPFGVSLVAAAGRDGVLRTLGERFQRQVRLKPGIDQKGAPVSEKHEQAR